MNDAASMTESKREGVRDIRARWIRYAREEVRSARRFFAVGLPVDAVRSLVRAHEWRAQARGIW